MSQNRLKVPPSEHDHRCGPLSASTVLIEYGDFECPHTAMAQPMIDRLIEEFGAKICFIYRHFPLSDLHPQAELAARASEAADLQACFWPMMHALLENYDALSIETIFAVARDVDLDLERFELDLSRPELAKKVRHDYLGGERSHVPGTPTFFLNGVRLDGPLNYRLLKQSLPGAGPII